MLITGIALENNTVEKLTSQGDITNSRHNYNQSPWQVAIIPHSTVFKKNTFFTQVEGFLLEKLRMFDIFPVQQKLCWHKKQMNLSVSDSRWQKKN